MIRRLMVAAGMLAALFLLNAGPALASSSWGPAAPPLDRVTRSP